MTDIMNTHIYRLVLSTAAICAMLASCDNRLPEPDVPSDEDRVPLELNVKASQATQTKGLIYGTAMPDGSCLGITVVEPDLDTYDGESFINIPYTASSSDGVQIWKPLKNQILLSTTTGNGYAYYPYSEEVTNIREIPVKATSEHQVDYMYAKKVNLLRKSNPTANLTLNHALCGVRLSFTRGTYAEAGVITSVSARGDALASSAILNAMDGTLSSVEAGETFTPQMDPLSISSENPWVEFIAIPGTESIIEFELCIDGKIVKLQTPKKIKLLTGYINRIAITVDKGSAYVTSTDVTEWVHDKVSNRIELNDHTITFGGVTDGLTFDSSVDEDGNVNIIVAPYLTKDAEVKPVTFEGDAMLIQDVDVETGLMTIKLSDINSDVTINFNGFYLWMTFVHEITDISQPTRIYYGGSPERIRMDGVDISTERDYQFETTGEHVMRMSIPNYKGYSYSLMQYIQTVKSAIFPEGVEMIGAWCFLGCANFKEVSLPSTLKSISYQAFERSGLVSCVVPDGCVMSYGVFDDCRSLTYVKLPSDMKTIPESTFQDAAILEHIDLPPGYTHIGERAFSGCAIKSFEMPDEMTTIEYGTFAYCKSLEEVRLPASLTKIDNRAFMYCTALKRVVQADGSCNEGEFFIPEGVTEIGGEYAFYFNSPYMHTIRIPSTLETIALKGAVSPMIERFVMNKTNPVFDVRNNSLIETATNTLIAGGTQSTVIHESVPIIGQYAFYDSMIEYVDLHSGVTEIQDNAFAFSRPKQIISRAITPPVLGTTPFQIAQYNGTLKVPQEALDAYRANWMINEVGYLGWSTARWGLVALAEGE